MRGKNAPIFWVGCLGWGDEIISLFACVSNFWLLLWLFLWLCGCVVVIMVVGGCSW